jgi:hypothetical protein
LSLAVVTAPARLQHRGEADGLDRGAYVGRGVDGMERRGRDPERAERPLLDDAVLRHLQRRRGREHRRDRLERTRSRRRDTLPLVGDHGRVRGRSAGSIDVVERTDDEVAHRGRGRPRARIEERERASERDACEAEHEAQLAPTQHRDPRHGAAR